jgi:hypothetical protein
LAPEGNGVFSIGDQAVRLCEGMTRRRWLCVGGLGAAGLLLPDLLRGRARARPASGTFGRARSCILCFLFGAPAHQDIWDLKPDAPAEIRGEFKPIASRVPGIRLGEHIPLVARQAHRFALLRAVQHPDNTHTVAMHYMLTGRRHAQPNTNPRNQPGDFPCFGAVVQHLRPPRSGLPSGISLNAPANQVSASNHIFPGFFAGILGHRYDPLFVAQDPSAPDFHPFPVADGSAAERLTRRRGLLAEVDGRRRRIDAVVRPGGFDAYQEQAFSLVTSSSARRAFELSREPPALRQRYGRSPFGQGLLLARRLVEAGVGLVTVNWARDDAFWDTHKDNFKDLKTKLLPPFDRGFSALLEDLDERGLLDETLVVCLGEFGRSPQINAAAGREHWAACNSVVFAGAGVRGGQVHGASDRHAAYPVTPPIAPDDLAATIYHALGIDPQTEIRDPLGRPLRLADGRVLHELF